MVFRDQDLGRQCIFILWFSSPPCYWSNKNSHNCNCSTLPKSKENRKKHAMLEAVNLKMFFVRYKVTTIIKSSMKFLSIPEHIVLFLAGHSGFNNRVSVNIFLQRRSKCSCFYFLHENVTLTNLFYFNWLCKHV